MPEIADRDQLKPPGSTLADPSVQRFPERLSLLVQEQPDAIALRFRHRGGDWLFWRWRDLQAQTQSATDGLWKLGFGASDVLWIGGDLGPHLLVLALAAWSIGGSVQPLADHLSEPASRRSGECRYVFLQGGAAVASRLAALTAAAQAAADLSPGRDGSGGLTAICDRLGLGQRAADPADGALRLFSYAALLGHEALPAAPLTRPPAALYWLEESGNDLGNVPALMDFWLRMRVPLTFPGYRVQASASRRETMGQGSCRSPEEAKITAAFAGA